ncbi:ankyrin repeat-containing protein NPR4-like [Gossypium arboreum]|uniref:ankyrin repeat-containing protein NPR4-like n=1 Tax=Gossypium arboreum TaxID=29729 RepID=UPI0008194DEA|nr:ankyrin repeat-containing protein NPR4-like [Gossypium arboreum]
MEELLKRDVSATYVGETKRGMIPLFMAAKQGYRGTVSKILSSCPDCCEKVDKKSLNSLHYMAFRDSVFQLLGSSVFKRGGFEIVYESARNLMELEGAFGIIPQEAYNAQNHFRKQHHKQEYKQIKDLLEEIENDQVEKEPIRHFHLRNVSMEILEATRNTHLLVAALIATIAFAVAITIPGGLKSEKGSVEGIPLLIHEATFKAFVVTNALALILSVSTLFIHFGVLDNLLYQFKFWRETVSYRTQSVSRLLGYAMAAMR